MTMRVPGCLCLCLCARLAVAADAPPPDDGELAKLQGLLDTGVVTSASRAQERADDAPATVTVVTADQLRRYGLRTLHEAINFLSLGLVAQDPLHAVEVGSRGVLLTADYGNHVLVLVDGHTLNEQWNGTAYFEQGLGVPIEFIDRIELIVGPGSVLYGSSAMLGVFNVVTKRARDLEGAQLHTDWSLSPPQDVTSAPRFDAPVSRFGGTGRVALLAGHEATLLGLPLELSFAAEYYQHQGQSLTFARQDGLSSNWGDRAPGPGSWGGTTTNPWWTRVSSGFVKARWGDVTLWVRGARYSRGSPAYDSLGVAADFDAPDLEQDSWVNVELSWARTVSPRLRLLARGYFDFYDYLTTVQSSSWQLFGTSDEPPSGRTPDDFTFRHQQNGGATWGGVEVQGTYDWLGDGRFPLMLGLEGRLRRFRDATALSLLDGEVFETTNVYQVDEWQAGAYLQQRARLLPQLQLNAGIRFDLQSGLVPRYAPRAALVWTLPWEGRLKLVFNRAYRAPSGYERFAEYAASQLPNPDLKSEIVTTGELGYEQRFGRQRLLLVGFTSRFERLVQFQQVPEEVGAEGLFWYQNASALWNVGGQGLLEGALGRFSYGLSFTGAVNLTDSPLVASPGWFGNARVSYELGERLPRLSLGAAFSGERLISTALSLGPNGETWAPGTTTVPPQLELRATVDAPVPAIKGLTLRGVVGGQVMPYSAYTVGPRQTPEGSFTTPAQAPNSRLFVMLTASWQLDPR
jgi:outer membrane receptor for ferrienterochelin and colicins